MTINCIAVDDEPLALDVINNHCKNVPYLNLMGQFHSALEAIEFVKEENIDLVFLDINMPEINGLSLKGFIPSPIQIVFVTAYEEHALESYDIGAIDYLLKPVSFERFFRATEKCKAQLLLGKRTAPPVNAEPSLFVRSDKKLIQIYIRDILYVEGLKDYAKIYQVSGEKVIIRESLQNIMNRLKRHDFIRTHRSYIISVNKISSLAGNQIFINDNKIPISRGYRPEVLEIFKGRGILGERN